MKRPKHSKNSDPIRKKYMDRKTGDKTESPEMPEKLDAPGMKGGGYCRGGGAAIRGTNFKGVF